MRKILSRFSEICGDQFPEFIKEFTKEEPSKVDEDSERTVLLHSPHYEERKDILYIIHEGKVEIKL